MNGAAGGFVPISPGPTSEPLEWHFSQVFGERTPGEEVQDADIISTVEFDHSGDYLATGDQGGRVVLFERTASRRPSAAEMDPDQRPGSLLGAAPYEYRYLTEFQSHEPEFDYLKSLEIEEKVNRVRWARGASSHMLLTTNDKTVKLWKVYEKRVVSLSDFNLQNGSSTLNAGAGRPPAGPSSLALPPDAALKAALGKDRAAAALRVPKAVATETVLASRCKRSYANAHAYHINSISLSSDQETFLSADDLRINLWHLDRPDLAYNVVDIKPPNMEDLTEVMTCAEFHPHQCSVFAYASSRGCIRLADMREAALCDQHSKLFEEPAQASAPRSFFSEIVASVNDARFSRCGRYLLSRDYMTLKLWDVAMENAPLAVYPVHECLRSKLMELYENDCIFDKFDVALSGDGSHFATGTYSSFFRVVPRSGGPGSLLEASRDPMRRRIQSAKAPSRFGLPRALRPEAAGPGEEAVGEDLGSKLLHLSWHPTASVIAAASLNSLYLFYGRDNRGE